MRQTPLYTGRAAPRLRGSPRVDENRPGARTHGSCLLVSAVATLLWLGLLPQGLLAQSTQNTSPPARVGHGDQGVEIATGDGRFLIQIQPRLQFRFSGGTLGDTVLSGRFTEGATFEVNRARLKIGGHAFRPELTYYLEYELQGTALLDFRAQYPIAPWLNVKVGQWKFQYSRERIISSGRQQLLDRSIVNSMFTIDRQQGMSLYGRAAGDGLADFSYWLTVGTGTGRAGEPNDDSRPLVMARLQWNPLGEPVDFAGSDLGARDEPSLLVAFAGVTNQSPYTRFSTSGGGQLAGFEPGEAGQYRVDQWLGETAFKYHGVSWQQEFHWKRIDDRVTENVTTLIGNYAQIGVLLGAVSPSLPEQLELALRHAVYDPDMDRDSDLIHELSLTSNWFFNGHSNKLSAEALWLSRDVMAGQDESGLTFRVQWDLSM